MNANAHRSDRVLLKHVAPVVTHVVRDNDTQILGRGFAREDDVPVTQFSYGIEQFNVVLGYERRMIPLRLSTA